LTRVFDPFPIKLFFWGATQKDKKLTAQKSLCYQYFLTTVSKKMTASKKYQITPGRSKY